MIAEPSLVENWKSRAGLVAAWDLTWLASCEKKASSRTALDREDDSTNNLNSPAYLPSVSLKSACISFQDFSSAALLYFIPLIMCLSAPGTVKLWTVSGKFSNL